MPLTSSVLSPVSMSLPVVKAQARLPRSTGRKSERVNLDFWASAVSVFVLNDWLTNHSLGTVVSETASPARSAARNAVAGLSSRERATLSYSPLGFTLKLMNPHKTWVRCSGVKLSSRCETSSPTVSKSSTT
eukprot:scaffold445087_cov31-Prasinocladus_malaysianus.AAC.1